MAKRCSVCGREPSTGHQVSHSNRKNNRRWLPNLQHVRVILQGAPRRVFVCTNCLRSGRVRRAI